MRAIWCLLLLPGVAMAEIYRWTDEQGRVHFGQRPAADVQAQQVEVRPQVIERDEETKGREERAARFYQARQAEQAQAAAEAAEQRRQRDAECAKLQRKLADIPEGASYYRKDAQGQRVYYSDEELDATRRQLRDRISERCS
ncbi:DUF4124 domain-containing protein [Pseudomonas xionganensis]|uniref:DUF4124 domain-containing protein n=1 Tax=Pseudomonas xionganensis TaxID=2654845 RepID=A0A6I4KRX2_9PSED|nr:DUF4124 domain-containing protein [Pseudomonas xionganensis]MVW74874.1 DUF4124 domain-containing protein [Pseudomonas xionganensis]